jgi:biopolymer transport protein ExbB/TolQ
MKKVFALLLGLIVLGIAAMASLVVLAVVAVMLLIGFARFWWQSRDLRAALKTAAQAHADAVNSGSANPASREASGTVIDGEAVVISDPPAPSEAVVLLPEPASTPQTPSHQS